MAQDIASSRTLAETVDRVMYHVGAVFAPLSWSLLLRDSRTGGLRFVHATGPGSEALRAMTLEKGHGVAGWVAEHGEALLIADTAEDTRFHSGIDAVTGIVTKSIIAVPLRARGQVYGVIELINRLDQSYFENRDLIILQTIADFAALAIERAYYLRSVTRLALTDALTGLANRRAFDQVLQREIERTKRMGSPFSLVLLDIDQFKAINDRHGHAAGDEALRAVGRILTASCRKSDCAARIGGDEFSILVSGSDTEAARQLVARLRRNLSVYNKNAPVPLALSIGVKAADPRSPETVFDQTDRAMYRMKNATGDPSLELEGQLQSWLDEPKD